MRHALSSLFFGLLCLIIGCQNQAIVTPLPPSPTPTVAPTATPTNLIITPPPPSLNVWFPTEMGDPQNLLSDEIFDAFQSSHPNLLIDVQNKPLNATGGILAYLRTGQMVAKAVLPDVTLVTTELLPTLAQEGLIYPLDEALFEEDAFFPSAESLALVEKTHYGYPFAFTGIYHLAYLLTDPQLIPDAQWSEFIKNPQQKFAFHAQGMAGARLVLQLYLSGGYSLTNEEGQLDLDRAGILSAIDLIQQGHISGVLPSSNGTIQSQIEAWQAFQTGASTSVFVQSADFLAFNKNNYGFAAQPGAFNVAMPLVRSWVWVITTNDPQSQALATDLVQLLSQPNLMGRWSESAYLLPAKPAAFEVWAQNSYTEFLQQQLYIAQPLPTAIDNLTLELLGKMVKSVLNASLAPSMAVDEFFQALTPSSPE